jgi:hypothetical protein
MSEIDPGITTKSGIKTSLKLHGTAKAKPNAPRCYAAAHVETKPVNNQDATTPSNDTLQRQVGNIGWPSIFSQECAESRDRHGHDGDGALGCPQNHDSHHTFCDTALATLTVRMGETQILTR